MPINPKSTALAKDIERLVDEALRHPERAERIKENLKQKVLGAERGSGRMTVARETSAYDLWDNVPV